MSNLFSLPKQTPVTASGGVYAGAKASFFRTGTGTPKDTYSDAALSVPNSNPVVADSGGLFGPIFLDTSDEEYRVTLKTSADVLIYTQDNVGNRIDSTLLLGALEDIGAAGIGEILFPRTQREINASVTPVNYAYPEGNLLRYGTNTTPGTTNMEPAFTAAISLKMPIFVPQGVYRHNGQMAPITQGGLIGEQWESGTNDTNTRIIFYNITGSTQAAIRLQYDVNTANCPRILENLDIIASSWDAATGANGYGVEVTGKSLVRNVQIALFESVGLFLHNTATDGQAPYNSIFEQVRVTVCGSHGIVVGTGANTCTFINCDAQNNGATAYGVAPVAAGNFDGFHVDFQNAGNPGAAFFSYVPEGLKIIGGDCSANSRYGWNFLAMQAGVVMTSYAEANYQATPGQVNLTNGISNSFLILDGIQGRRAGVNFSMIASGSNLGSNRVFVGGRDCGGGQSNTEASNIQMANALGTTYFGHNSDFTTAARISCGTDGVANMAADGAGYWNLAGTPLRYSAVQVLGARRTGWGTATGTATRTTFDTATVTTAQLAERVKALIDDLHGTAGHGLIGT